MTEHDDLRKLLRSLAEEVDAPRVQTFISRLAEGDGDFADEVVAFGAAGRFLAEYLEGDGKSHPGLRGSLDVVEGNALYPPGRRKMFDDDGEEGLSFDLSAVREDRPRAGLCATSPTITTPPSRAWRNGGGSATRRRS